MPAAAPAQRGHEEVGEQEGAGEVGREGLRELAVCRGFHRLHVEHACVADHDVGEAELSLDPRQRSLHGGGVRHVAMHVGLALGRAILETARLAHHVRPSRAQRVRDGAPDPPRGARHERDLPLERDRGGGHSAARPPCTRRRNSSRVFASWSSAPRSALVTVFEFCFSTPRIIMQRWYASITTPTPKGSSTSMSASATWSVSRSWTWSRRANTSITRGILESPTKRPFGK